MPRARSKDELLQFAQANYGTLMKLIDGMSEVQRSTPFDFSDDAAKKEAHWARDKNVRDVLVHLYEWHQLMIQFIENNAGAAAADANVGPAGTEACAAKSAIAFLPPEYSWKTYGAMNLKFWEKHQNTSLEAAKAMLAESHKKVMELAEKYTNEELFTKKYFPWTGTTDLGSYFVSSTSSHYDWAIKKIKAHCKKVG